MKKYPEHNISYHGPVVVFDLDDTLYKERDFALSGFRAVSSLFADNPFPKMKEAFLCGENPMDAALSHSASPSKPSIDEMLSAYRNHIPQISLSPGARQLLDTLRDKAIPMGLITDGRSASQRNKIRALGLDEYFSQEMIFISEETGCEKTSPASFREIVRMWPEASRFFYIGDNPEKDFIIPNIMGWTTIQSLQDNQLNIHPPFTDTGEDYMPRIKTHSLTDIINIII